MDWQATLVEKINLRDTFKKQHVKFLHVAFSYVCLKGPKPW